MTIKEIENIQLTIDQIDALLVAVCVLAIMEKSPEAEKAYEAVRPHYEAAVKALGEAKQ